MFRFGRRALPACAITLALVCMPVQALTADEQEVQETVSSTKAADTVVATVTETASSTAAETQNAAGTQPSSVAAEEEASSKSDSASEAAANKTEVADDTVAASSAKAQDSSDKAETSDEAVGSILHFRGELAHLPATRRMQRVQTIHRLQLQTAARRHLLGNHRRPPQRRARRHLLRMLLRPRKEALLQRKAATLQKLRARQRRQKPSLQRLPQPLPQPAMIRRAGYLSIVSTTNGRESTSLRWQISILSATGWPAGSRRGTSRKATMLSVQASAGSWRECAAAGILALGRGAAWPCCMQREGPSAASRERPGGAGRPSAASRRGTDATGAMGHAPPRGGRRRATGDAGRRGGSPALRLRRGCARPSRTGAGPRTRQAAGPGARTAEGAPRAARRSAAGSMQARPACRKPAPKAGCGAACAGRGRGSAGRGPRRGAGSGSRRPSRRGWQRPVPDRAPAAGRTARPPARGQRACPRSPAGHRGSSLQGDAGMAAGASPGPRPRFRKGVRLRRPRRTGAGSSRGMQRRRRPPEACSSVPAAYAIPGRSRRRRTPAASSASSSRRAPASAGSRTGRCSMRRTRSTAGRGRSWNTGQPARPTGRCCTQLDNLPPESLRCQTVLK